MYRLITVTMLWAASGEAFQLQPETASRRIHSTTLLMGSSEDKSENPKEEPIVEATVKIDDGGSNLTDRFKYKVNALMGVFDPQDGVDDERQDGNILNGELEYYRPFIFNHLFFSN